MKNLILLLTLTFLLAACSQEEEEVNAGRYGMMSNDTPQYNAILFMRSVYRDEGLDRAVSLSSERFGRILQNHHTPKNIQRHVLNLRLDSARIEPVSGGTLIYSDLQKEAEIEVKIIGTYEGEQRVDLKTLSMVRESGKWLVTDIKNTIP